MRRKEQATKQKPQRKNKLTILQKICLILTAIVIILFSAPIWNSVVFPPVENPNFGVSFSAQRSEEYGLDWKENYIALQDDLKIRNYRLMSYWDQGEPKPGQYDFEDLDWQMDQAAERGSTVSLAIGLRQPRWPECHQPAWAEDLNQTEWKESLYAYIETVVTRYTNHPALISWQLENEATGNLFGECEPYDRQRLIEEYKLVDELTDKPIYMSLSDQHGLPFNDPVPDKFGMSVYRVVHPRKSYLPEGYVLYPTPVWYHRARAAIVTAYTGRETFIHELQLEPWGPDDNARLNIAEQDKSMSPQQIEDNLLFAKRLGMEDIYTWGGEWWYWRLQQGDNQVWETVREGMR